ncbi:hypothetical protein HDU79_002984 [Rhizoclosmatium sp. JEL0117]|nr:hypothetical protein HDU79_002984 [Rhizoclosmatium sp. JEL0117]
MPPKFRIETKRLQSAESIDKARLAPAPATLVSKEVDSESRTLASFVAKCARYLDALSDTTSAPWKPTILRHNPNDNELSQKLVDQAMKCLPHNAKHLDALLREVLEEMKEAVVESDALDDEGESNPKVYHIKAHQAFNLFKTMHSVITLTPDWTERILHHTPSKACEMSQTSFYLPPERFDFQRAVIRDFVRLPRQKLVVNTSQFGNIVIYEPRTSFIQSHLNASFNAREFSFWFLTLCRKIAVQPKVERRASNTYRLLVIHIGFWAKPQSFHNLGLESKGVRLAHNIPQYTRESLAHNTHGLLTPAWSPTVVEMMSNSDFKDFVQAIDSWVLSVAPFEYFKGRLLMKRMKELYGMECPFGSKIFPSFAVNCSPLSKMMAHLDFSDAFNSMAVVVCLADTPFRGGDLVLWQLHARVRLKQLDLCMFRSRVIVHGNTEVKLKQSKHCNKLLKEASESELKRIMDMGGRGSIVFFTGSGLVTVMKKCAATRNEVTMLDHLYSDEFHGWK